MFMGISLGKAFKDINPKYCIEHSLEHAKLLLAAKPCSTGKYDVIFSTDVLDSFLGAFKSLFGGQSAMEGKNRWAKERGKLVASSLLTISDRPMFAQALHRQLFDSEGVLSKDVEIIKNGEMVDFLHSCETANYFGQQSNGHGLRSAQGKLGVAASTLYIAPGQSSDIWSGVVLKIIKLDGLHSGTNSISGDFSLGASGLLMRDGEIIQPVKGITLSGNFFEMVKQISAVGNKVEPSNDFSLFAPEIRFTQIDVAG
jgi:PmbA protein